LPPGISDVLAEFLEGCVFARVLRALLAAACALAACPCNRVAAAAAAVRPDSPYGVHSMVYSDAPWGFKAAMFREAAALGASSIRVDVFVPAIVPEPNGERDWRALDDYIRLARLHRLQVVGVLLGTPWWLARCPAGVSIMDVPKCAASDPHALAGYMGEIARRARGVIDDWEILNEPDGRWASLATPADYAHLFTAAAAAIHAANPGARVLLGAMMTLADRPWLEATLAVGRRVLTRSVDVAAVHVRARLGSLARTIHIWRAFFARHHVDAPIWVTEHGYPADPAYQNDPGFGGGETAQAAYLSRSLPALLHAGAARVFVTERDNLAGAFASEGLLTGTVDDPPVANPVIRTRPAAATFAALARGLA
jgi:hypothetical protein